MLKYNVERTDTFNGEANYSWVRRAKVVTPELPHYGYTGGRDGSYMRADRIQSRELMRRAKAAVGLTGARGRKEVWGDTIAFYPHGRSEVMFIYWDDRG